MPQKEKSLPLCVCVRQQEACKVRCVACSSLPAACDKLISVLFINFISLRPFAAAWLTFYLKPLFLDYLKCYEEPILRFSNTSAQSPPCWHLDDRGLTHTHVHAHPIHTFMGLTTSSPSVPFPEKNAIFFATWPCTQINFPLRLAPSLPPLSITSSLSLSLCSYGNALLYVSFSNQTVLSDCLSCHIPALPSPCGVSQTLSYCFFLVTSIQASQ